MSGEACPKELDTAEPATAALDPRIVEALAGLSIEPGRCFLCDQIVAGGGQPAMFWGGSDFLVKADAQLWHLEHCFVPVRRAAAP